MPSGNRYKTTRYNRFRVKSRASAFRSRRKLNRRTRYTRRRRAAGGKAIKGAQSQLKKFRQSSVLAIALTGFLLMLIPEENTYSQADPAQQEAVNEAQEEELPDSVSIIRNIATQDIAQPADTAEEIKEPEDISKAAKNEAVTTLTNLWEGFYNALPQILVGVIIFILAWLLVRLLKFVLRRTIGGWQKSGAIITLLSISIWLLAIGLAVSIIAGDIRALVGSLGLVGLALSWSLQTPIESFTGWLLNSFKGYYRIGDRINVGEVFGDVYKIDFLTTTVWEVGAPYREGFVQAEQPTGRLVTFPNNEILAGSVVNLTGDFPYVWDELAIAVANESDIKEAIKVLKKVADNYLGSYMIEPAQQYHNILKKAGLDYNISEEPQISVSIGESWTDIVIRYLVGARERRKWKSGLSVRIMEELNKKEYSGKIKPVYPRQQVQFITPEGQPTDFDVRH